MTVTREDLMRFLVNPGKKNSTRAPKLPTRKNPTKYTGGAKPKKKK